MRPPLTGDPQVDLPSFECPEMESTPISGPQVTPMSVGGPQVGPTPFSGPQGGHHISFGFVFDVSSGQGGNSENNGNGRNCGIIGSRTA